MFIDEIKIFARAGHGGKGAIAFHREAYITKGGPSGGNGGRGGDVILEASHDLNNLIGQFFNPRLIAEVGQGGMGKGMDGRAGEDLVVKVPCGTMVWALPKPEVDLSEETEDASKPKGAPTIPSSHARSVIRSTDGAQAREYNLADEEEAAEVGSVSAEKGELVADLTTHGQRFVLCKAGRGGLGNRNFATARHQTPRFAQPGEAGDEGDFFLELRIMADVGIVGYPNAGKSTLLAAISHARPKVAAYPFTTLHPHIGILEYPDWHRLTVCDVPGIIEGAHMNVGLGHKFLRHIKRCKILVLLLDMAGTDAREPWDDYKQLLSELNLYDPALLDKPRYVVANKMDEPQAEANLKKFKQKIRRVPVLPITAAFDEGVAKFKQLVREAVEEAIAADEK
ncbi:MAG: GTPase ObgE [Pedosphaera sp.]|nr:GTPase ObgE [Pedosphaera sp.]MSS99852.1 GTPase ObgE [Pedosphaera sp.]